MRQKNIGKGLCLGIGGTNARVALCSKGKILNFVCEPTPTDSAQFFSWMANEVIRAVDEEAATWVVIGLPGIVADQDGEQTVGPLPNVPGLADKMHYFCRELSLANPRVAELLKDGFPIVAVNDGLLAAYAAAERYGNTDTAHYDSIAYVIVGTGVGAAIVRRQKNGIFRPSESLLEIGHMPLNDDLDETFETMIAGPHLHRKHGVKAEEMESDHVAWKEVGFYTGQMAIKLGIIGGAELVVIGGGVGSHAYPHYYPYLEAYLKKFRASKNVVQRLGVPKVLSVPSKDAQTFEMYGAEGAIRHWLAQRAD